MGRNQRKQSKSSAAAASCGMMTPMMMPPVAPSRESSSSDDEQAKAPQLDPRCAGLNDGVAIPPPGERKPITRSATTLKQLGRVNLANILFLLDKSFDGGFTSLLTVGGLLALLYVLTRLRPTCNLRDLCFLHHHLAVNHFVCFDTCSVVVLANMRLMDQKFNIKSNHFSSQVFL